MTMISLKDRRTVDKPIHFKGMQEGAKCFLNTLCNWNILSANIGICKINSEMRSGFTAKRLQYKTYKSRNRRFRSRKKVYDDNRVLNQDIKRKYDTEVLSSKTLNIGKEESMASTTRYKRKIYESDCQIHNNNYKRVCNNAHCIYNCSSTNDICQKIPAKQNGGKNVSMNATNERIFDLFDRDSKHKSFEAVLGCISEWDYNRLRDDQITSTSDDLQLKGICKRTYNEWDEFEESPFLDVQLYSAVFRELRVFEGIYVW